MVKKSKNEKLEQRIKELEEVPQRAVLLAAQDDRVKRGTISIKKSSGLSTPRSAILTTVPTPHALKVKDAL